MGRGERVNHAESLRIDYAKPIWVGKTLTLPAATLWIDPYSRCATYTSDEHDSFGYILVVGHRRGEREEGCLCIDILGSTATELCWREMQVTVSQ